MNFFTDKELSCKCCGENKFNVHTLDRLNKLRAFFGKPIRLTSAYRCEAYNNKIGATQTHATGQAVDIQISGKDAHRLIALATDLGFTGVGISQKGDYSKRFIHLDDLEEADNRPRPHLWSY